MCNLLSAPLFGDSLYKVIPSKPEVRIRFRRGGGAWTASRGMGPDRPESLRGGTRSIRRYLLLVFDPGVERRGKSLHRSGGERSTLALSCRFFLTLWSLRKIVVFSGSFGRNLKLGVIGSSGFLTIETVTPADSYRQIVVRQSFIVFGVVYCISSTKNLERYFDKTEVQRCRSVNSWEH